MTAARFVKDNTYNGESKYWIAGRIYMIELGKNAAILIFMWIIKIRWFDD